MKFAEGLFTGMALTIMGCVAYTIMFPQAKEDMCQRVKKISKDMKKDIENMM